MSPSPLQNRNGVRKGRPNLKQEAAQFIRDQILSGVFKPGDKVDQDAIADALGISRLPVREALILLESEGLVDNVARRGAFVAEIDASDILDHYEMFGVLSGMAAQRAASLLTEDDLAELDALVENMRTSSDPRQHDQFNYEFHRAINRAGSSRRLTAVLRTLSASMPTHFFEFNVEWEHRAIDEHQAIVDALRSGDGHKAATMMAEHFRNVGTQAVSMLEAAAFWDNTPQASGDSA